MRANKRRLRVAQAKRHEEFVQSMKYISSFGYNFSCLAWDMVSLGFGSYYGA